MALVHLVVRVPPLYSKNQSSDPSESYRFVMFEMNENIWEKVGGGLHIFWHI